MSLKISLVTLVVPDYQSAIDFYCRVLGFDLIEDRALSATKRWVVIRPPNCETGLLLAKADNEAQRAAIGGQTGGRVGFFLETDDFARDQEKFLAGGVVFEEQPRHESYAIVAVFRDPLGNRWDLIQPTP